MQDDMEVQLSTIDLVRVQKGVKLLVAGHVGSIRRLGFTALLFTTG